MGCAGFHRLQIPAPRIDHPSAAPVAQVPSGHHPLALGPAVTESPLVTSGAISKQQLGDLFMRGVISMLFLPGGRAHEMPAAIAALVKVDVARQAKAKPRRGRATAKAS